MGERGDQHAYIGGGAAIQAFIHLKPLNEITFIKAPMLLGEGIPLLGKISMQIQLHQAEAFAFEHDFVQLHYSISYP